MEDNYTIKEFLDNKLFSAYKEKSVENTVLKNKLNKQAKHFEFSKFILLAVMFTYFLGLGFGIYAVNKILMEYPEWAIQALISIFGYVGAPISVAIGFYSWKAKNENALKIQNTNNNSIKNIEHDLGE